MKAIFRFVPFCGLAELTRIRIFATAKCNGEINIVRNTKSISQNNSFVALQHYPHINVSSVCETYVFKRLYFTIWNNITKDKDHEQHSKE